MMHLFTVRFTFHRSFKLFVFYLMPEAELVYLAWLQIREIFKVWEWSALCRVR